MMIPEKTNLPFFSYGLFQPGELGFLRIAPFVERIQPGGLLRKRLRVRDGLAIVDEGHEGRTPGSIIWFRSDQICHAYLAIADLEPEHIYRWKEAVVEFPTESTSANVLFGLEPERGSEAGVPWKGREDPIFTHGLTVIEDELAAADSCGDVCSDPRAIFRLQMAYLLLWSAIERYMSLRYGLGEDIMQKIKELAKEIPPFRTQVDYHPEHLRRICRSSDPKKDISFDPQKPLKWLEYFYQVRSNVTHRGKAAFTDFNLLRTSLIVLLGLFRLTKDAAFNESESRARDFGVPQL